MDLIHSNAKRHDNNKYQLKASIYKAYYYPTITVSLQTVSFLFLLLFYLQVMNFQIFIPPKDKHDTAQNGWFFISNIQWRQIFQKQ